MTLADTASSVFSRMTTVFRNDPPKSFPIEMTLSTRSEETKANNDSGYSSHYTTPSKNSPANTNTSRAQDTITRDQESVDILATFPQDTENRSTQNNDPGNKANTNNKKTNSITAPNQELPDIETANPQLKKRLFIFDKEVDDATSGRFKIVQDCFDRLLGEYVLKNRKLGSKYKPISTRLAMIGPSPADAAPHIVVFCVPEQKRLIQKFAKKDIVQDICQSQDPGVPSFHVTVVGKAPKPRLASSPVVTTGRNCVNNGTMCGTPIRIAHHSNGECRATFGGIVKVVTAAGDVKLYGITAGHAVQEWHDTSNREADDTEHHGLHSETRELVLIDADLLAFAEEDPDADDSEEEFDFEVASRSNLGSGQWQFLDPIALGSVLADAWGPGDRGDCCDKYYDWALLETTFYEMNQLPGITSKAQLFLSHRMPGTTGTRRVHMVGGSGNKPAQLSSTSGQIVLGPGKEFVETYMITLLHNQAIFDGDSGSWIIDSDTFEVYGHVVATDMFGSGYVIPLEKIFDDIKRHLKAQKVGLPSVIDILHARTVLQCDAHGYPVHGAVAGRKTEAGSNVGKLTLDNFKANHDSGYNSYRSSI